MSKVSDQELLAAFERMCRMLGKVSRGFDVDAITAPIDGPRYDGTSQWAMKRVEGFGWMVVCGAGGCGAALGLCWKRRRGSEIVSPRCNRSTTCSAI